MRESAPRIGAVWRHQGRIRDWFHTKRGARFLNVQTAWFRVLAPRGYAFLTTIRFVVVAITGHATGWYHNVQANRAVTLHVRARDRTGRVRAPSLDELQAARTAYCDKLYSFDFVSSLVNQRGAPRSRRIREMHTRWFDEGTVFIIDPAQR